MRPDEGKCSRLSIQSSGFRVEVLEFRVSVLEFRVMALGASKLTPRLGRCSSFK